MSHMKNLFLALDELKQAEARALTAGKWTPVDMNGETYWRSPGAEHKVLAHDDAVSQLKGTWEAKLS